MMINPSSSSNFISHKPIKTDSNTQKSSDSVTLGHSPVGSTASLAGSSGSEFFALRNSLKKGDGAFLRARLKGASADQVETLKGNYRQAIGRDLEFDVRGLSPLPYLSFGPGFSIRVGDGLEGEELKATLRLLKEPEAEARATKLDAILSKEKFEPRDFSDAYRLLQRAGGEERALLEEKFEASGGGDLLSSLSPLFALARSHNDSRQLPSRPEQRVAVVVSSGNWKKQLSGEHGKPVGGYHWREIEAYVEEALQHGYTPIFFTPDGLPASPDSLSLLQGKIAPRLGFGMLPGTGPDSPQGQVILHGLERPRSLSSFRPEDFATLHVAGGHGSHHDLVGHPDLEKAAKGLSEGGKLVTAVCHATPALGELLKGRPATGFSPQYDAALLKAGYVLPEFDPPYNAHQGLRRLGAHVSTAAAFNIHHTEQFEKNGAPVITGTGPEATDNVARLAFAHLNSAR